MKATATDLIRKIDFFESLNPKIINHIARLCAELDYNAGEHVVRQGDPGLGLFFILQGSVNVDVEKNAVRTTVATLQPGDFFGELSLIDNKPRSAHVTCVEDTHCLVLTRDSFLKLTNKYPEIGLQIAIALAGRLRAANEKLGAMSSLGGEQPPSYGQDRSPTGEAPPPPHTQDQKGQLPGKEQMKDFLVSTFGFLYMVKAMTRFSAALIGCPVHVEPLGEGSEVAQAIVHNVKVVMFPSSAEQVLRIAAFADGNYSAIVMRPGNPVSTLEGRISRSQTLLLHIPASAEPWMESVR